MKKLKLHPNACPMCGERFKLVCGIWRCANCQINKKYDNDDGRPRDFYQGRIQPTSREIDE